MKTKYRTILQTGGDGSVFKTYEDLPICLTVKDLQKVFGIGQVQAYQLTHSEGFPAVKIGGNIRIPKPELIKWIQAQAAVQLQ